MNVTTHSVRRMAAHQQPQRRSLRRCWTGIGNSGAGATAAATTTASIDTAIGIRTNTTSSTTSSAFPAMTIRSPSLWSSWSSVPITKSTASTRPPAFVEAATRSFASASGGGSDGDGGNEDENIAEKTPGIVDKEDKDKGTEPSVAESFLLGDKDDDGDVEALESIAERPLVIDLDSHSNADTDEYDPFAITESFGDTSYYYYPPSHEQNDPNVLKQRYEGMTNEELLDGSTISVQTDEEGKTHTWDSLIHSPPVRDKHRDLPRGTLVGTVVSTKMQKTVNVAVDRYKIHKKYRKRIRYTRKFMAHDEKEVASDGDLVVIVPSQRISKNKHFVLREILRAKGQL